MSILRLCNNADVRRVIRPNLPWSETSTLGETVVRMVKERRTDSDEFRALLKFYGREKLLAEYYKAKGVAPPAAPPPVGYLYPPSWDEVEVGDEIEPGSLG